MAAEWHPNNNTTGNNSAYLQIPSSAVETYAPLVILILAVFLNGIFIAAFVEDRQIRTPFSVYLLNLAVTDIGFAVLEMSGRFINGYYDYWPFTNPAACTFWLYCQLIFPAAQVNSVFLISVDRLGAVCWPVAYRAQVTKRRSLYVVLGMWVWLNAYHIPGLVRDRALNMTEPTIATSDCRMGYQQPSWALWMNILIYVAPQVLLMGFCCVLVWKIKRRFGAVRVKPLVPKSNPDNGALQRGHNDITGRPTSSAHVEHTNSGGTLIISNNGPNPLPEVSPANPRRNKQSNLQQAGTDLSRPARLRGAVRSQIERRAVWTLLALATVVTLFWLPADIYYFMLGAHAIGDSPTFESVQLILSYTVTILNPLLYHALNHDIRRAVRKLFVSRPLLP
ncbi:hypothetical protein BV898_07134 [Hypsibius exemplaris]|uniref:G-protein coupled receptors family 1 profile domain-containing protein n=1 Tax=Hypsibius exemplaris TaxID=2072580 RepID=A0A1W0WUK7_HYPEX|nr:hypothetical protein BV898_07134 [Hypsibius exemplaris]